MLKFMRDLRVDNLKEDVREGHDRMFKQEDEITRLRALLNQIADDVEGIPGCRMVAVGIRVTLNEVRQ